MSHLELVLGAVSLVRVRGLDQGLGRDGVVVRGDQHGKRVRRIHQHRLYRQAELRKPRFAM